VNILKEGHMEINAKHFGDKSIITIDKNKFIGVEGETFQNLVNNSIDRGSKNISIDLSKVNYISSSGVELLMHAYKACSKKNVGFDIEGANNLVKDVLSNLKLSKIFNIS
jgi:anti-anti-sigma factor